MTLAILNVRPTLESGVAPRAGAAVSAVPWLELALRQPRRARLLCHWYSDREGRLACVWRPELVRLAAVDAPQLPLSSGHRRPGMRSRD